MLGEINNADGEVRIIESSKYKFDLTEGEEIELFLKESFGPHLNLKKLRDFQQIKEDNREVYILDFCPYESNEEGSLIYEVKMVKEK